MYTKKNAYEREELANMINQRISSVETVVASRMNEVQAFMYTVHSDFENFITKHKKDHTSLGIR